MCSRRGTLAFLAIVCLANASRAADAVGDPAGNVIKDWVATINQNDPKKLLAFYDESEETEIVVSAGLVYRGFEAIAAIYEDSAKHVHLYDSSARKIRTRLLGATAIVTFEHVFKFREIADDARWQVHIRSTSVLHRFGDRWKIVHEHSSPIRGVEPVVRIEDAPPNDSD